MSTSQQFYFFFFNDTATTEIYTLSLHDALPISGCAARAGGGFPPGQHRPESGIDVGQICRSATPQWPVCDDSHVRSEEHTSELQSQSNLVCRLLLEKKKHQELQQP